MRICNLFFAALLLPLSGCLEVDSKILVNANGSGTLTERIVLKGPMAAMMQQMSGDGASVIDQQQVEQHARELGRGVKVSSVKPLAESEGIGAVAVFTFDDINELQVNPNPAPGDSAQSAPSIASAAAPISFHLAQGSPAVLTVKFGEQREAKPSAAPRTKAEPSPTAPGMIKQMLAGMRIAVTVSVGGHIIETNASWRDGNAVTLIELDFDTILANSDGLEAMQSQSDATLQEMKKLLQAIPGVKVEPQAEVRIVFTSQTMANN